jgi:hypothetical protein
LFTNKIIKTAGKNAKSVNGRDFKEYGQEKKENGMINRAMINGK